VRWFFAIKLVTYICLATLFDAKNEDMLAIGHIKNSVLAD
jgi:hypothetical protein